MYNYIYNYVYINNTSRPLKPKFQNKTGGVNDIHSSKVFYYYLHCCSLFCFII